MLSEADNQILTRTNQGTPMGQFMRSHWFPFILSDELERDGAPQEDHAPRRTRDRLP